MGAAVECHSGHAYAERPRAFRWQGERFEIKAIVAEWQTPQGKHFRVQTTDGQNFELVYKIDADAWEIFHHR
jgi:putative sterol carrier protein